MSSTIDWGAMPTKAKTKQKNEEEEEKKENEVIKSKYPLSFPDNALLDRAYGVLIGAAIGDSLGSYCEFQKNVDTETLDEAMQMNGGGTWKQKVIAGQVTDDTELAVACSYGLIQSMGLHKATQIKRSNYKQTDDEKSQKSQKKFADKRSYFDLRFIAKEYEQWLLSNPFDIGMCTSTCLRQAPNVKNMKEKAFKYNQQRTKTVNNASSIFMGNMANGATMRCMSLCVYGYKLNESNLYKIMKEDASLTHAHFCVYIVDMCYALMIQSLLSAKANNKRSNLDAFEAMIKWLETQCKIKKRNKFEKSLSENEKEKQRLKCEAAKEILENWLEYLDVHSVVEQNEDVFEQLHPATIHQGFVKIAFQRACYHLLRGTGFKEAMRSVVGEGGDTDTNACIVGGLMGAYHGLSGIPNAYIVKIQECEPTYDEKRDKFQAKWYFIDKIPELLIENAPNDENFCCLDEY